MKILVVGGGGREHTIAWKIKQDERVSKVYVAPGNGGISRDAEIVDIPDDDVDGLLNFARDKKIDLTIIGPELPLSLGIVDQFKKSGLRVFGVDKKCSQLESSKDFSKAFMEKYNIPTAKYRSYTDSQSAKEGIKEFNYPLVIKADGLCAGKGVVICEDEKMAINTIDEILEDKIFGEEGSKIIIEEFLDGVEVSLLCLVSDNKIIPLEPAEDYKQIYDNDQGPNTGGIGCYSPSKLLTDEIYRSIEEDVFKNIENGFKEEGMVFNGVLFIGFMVVDGVANVLEFNVRFGDPESQVVIPRLKNSLLEIIEKTIDGELEESDLEWNKEPAMTVIVTSKGYPDKPITGFEIEGLDDLDKDIVVFHNGSKKEDGKYMTSGGRVLSITSVNNQGRTMEEIREHVYKNVEKINFEGMHYRTDIAKDIDY